MIFRSAIMWFHLKIHMSPKGSIDDALQLVYKITGVKISKGKAIDLIKNSVSDFDSFYEKEGRLT